MKVTDFLPEHRKLAAQHQQCLYDLILRMEEQLITGSIEEVELCRRDMANSIREIMKMKQQKKNNYAFRSTLRELKARGVDVAVVLRKELD